jgi:Fic family protein
MDTKQVVWNGIPVDAAAPTLLAAWDPDSLSARTARRTERAAAAARRFGDRTVGTAEVAARLLLRAEGLASSSIEGLRAPAAEVALAEADPSRPTGSGVAGWVADNLAVITAALEAPPPLDVEQLLGWHTRLMLHATTIEAGHIGAWRDTLGWVGGPNPRLSVHVAAPADDIPFLMDDLIRFVARDDVDPVTSAAVAHAQFETIHPFADGNGRIGRVLVGWILRQRLRINYPPPVSLQMARDVGGYQAGLTLYRQDQVDAWVAWFADAVISAAERSGDVLDAIARLADTWNEAVSDLRSDSAARRLCDQLPAHPVVSSLSAADLLGVSRQAAAVALAALEARGIILPLDGAAPGRNRRQRWWVAAAILNLLGTR